MAQPDVFDFADEGAENTPQNAQNSPESFDFSEGRATPLPDEMDFSEATPGVQSQPGAKAPFHPGQILDAFMSSIDPEAATDIFGPRAKEGIGWTDKTTIFEGLKKDIQDLPHMLTDIALTPATYLLSPLIGRLGTKPITEAMKNLTPTDLKTQVAERAARDTDVLMPGQSRTIHEAAPGSDILEPRTETTPARPMSGTKSAIETRAFPDAEDLLPLRKPTGRILVTPDFEPGFKTEAVQSDTFVQAAPKPFRIPKGGKPRLTDEGTIDMIRPHEPQLTPGEYGTGEQTSLLGGYNVRGDASHLTGKAILEAEDQLATGMSVLRPQTQFRAGSTAKEQQRLQDWALGPLRGKGGVEIDPGLRGRVLSPKMEKDLTTPPPIKGEQPITITPSKTGKSVSITPGDSFSTVPELDLAAMSQAATLPGPVQRGVKSGLDAVRTMGPAQQAAADLIETSYTNRAILSSQDFLKAEEAITKVAPPSNVLQRGKVLWERLAKGENAFTNGLRRSYSGISEADQESIFNHLYTSGRMGTNSPKSQAIADAIYDNILYPASSDPGVQGLMIKNPFTGTEFPVGPPNKFLPQQPIKEFAFKAINNTQWDILYRRAGADKHGYSLEDFKKTVISMSSKNHEIEAVRMKGLENMRLLDLEALGGSPYQWAKKLGYQTDPLVAAFKFNSLARLRGQFTQVEPAINAVKQSMAKGAPETEWFHDVMDRAMLDMGKFDAWTNTRRGLQAISHALDITMLQKGGIANMAQASYTVARGGIRNSFKGMLDLITGADRKMVFESGAMHPSLMAEMIHPSGPYATFSTAAFRMYGLSLADRFTRAFAGHVANNYIDGTVKQLLKKPHNTTLQKLIKELGGDPQAILQQQTIPDDMKLRMMQRFANNTSGVTDVRGVPYWATTENPWARLVLKFRTFLTANTAELNRSILNAPTIGVAAKRATRLLLGSGLIGGSIYNLEETVRQQLSGADPKKKETWVEALAPLVYGLGTFEGSMIMSAANRNAESAVLSAVGGPGAGVAASFVQDLTQTLQKGPGWRTVDTLSKRLPLVGPITGPLTSEQVHKESERDAYKQRLLHE